MSRRPHSEARPFRPCNLCGGWNVSLYIRLRSNGLEALRCRDCDMVYIGNNPLSDEELPKLYTMEAFEGRRHFQSQEWYVDYYVDCLKGYSLTSPVVRQFVSILETISRHGGGKRLLDIGCATGVLLDLARHAGFETMGTEVSQELAEYARSNFNLEVRVGELFEHGFPDAAFDVVTMLDVIEHIPLYDRLLPEIRRVLKPGGLFVCRTPIEEAFLRTIAKLLYALSWRRWDLPLLWFYSFDHVNSFSKRTLTCLLDTYGFRVVEMRSQSETPARLNVPGMIRAGLVVAETIAGMFDRRHKVLAIARRT